MSRPGRLKRRRLGSIGVVASLAIGATLTAGGDVGAEEVLAFAMSDCTRPGDQFVLAKGDDLSTTAAAVDDAGAVVAELTVQSSAKTPPVRSQSFRFVTVAPNTEYAGVKFTGWTGATQTVAPVVEDCAPAPVDVTTANPGRGIVAVKPQRLLDTRDRVVAGQAATAVVGGNVVEVAVLGQGGVPAKASAVMLNVAAVLPQAVGHLRVFPCGTKLPKTSSLNFVAGETRAANVFVKPGANGKVCIYTSSRTDILADVQGFTPANAQPVAITPVRVVDTRVGQPVDGPDLLPRKKVNGEVRLDADELVQAAGVPADARSFVINVTVANATARGFVTVNICLPERPPMPGPTSTLNFSPGRATANMAITQTNFDRFYFNSEFRDGVCLYTSGPVDLIVDITGYSTSPYASPTSFNNRFRALDTRPKVGERPATSDNQFSGTGRMKAGTEYKVRIGGRESAPYAPVRIPQQTTVLLNATAIRPDANGYVTVYECGRRPTTSNINVRAGDVVANAALVKLDKNGDVCVYSSVATDMALDVTAFAASASSLSLTTNTIAIGRQWQKFDLPIAGGTPPFTVTGTMSKSAPVNVDENGIIGYAGDPTADAYGDGKFTITDAEGKQVSFAVVASWVPSGADYPPFPPYLE